SYIIKPKANLAHGTQLRNIALITFDYNPPIATNQADPHDPGKGTDPAKEALVTIDAKPPEILKHTINGTLMQRSKINSLELTFAEDTEVQVAADALQLFNQTTGQSVSASNARFSYDPISHIGTFSLVGITLPDGNYMATLKAAGVSDSGGLFLTRDYDL